MGLKKKKTFGMALVVDWLGEESRNCGGVWPRRLIGRRFSLVKVCFGVLTVVLMSIVFDWESRELLCDGGGNLIR